MSRNEIGMLTTNTQISVAQPRETVQVQLPDRLLLRGAVGTTIEAFLEAARDQLPDMFDSPIMGGVFNGRLRELSYAVQYDGLLEPILLSHSDGGRIYRRSLVMLLTTAVDELFPGTRVNVGYALPDGGFYCTLLNRQPFSREELDQLSAHMRQIVAADEPITLSVVTLKAAVKLFEARGDDDKVRLLEQRDREDLKLYTLRGRADYHYGYMVPSTSYLRLFRLVHMGGGFVLQYPRKEQPDLIKELAAHPKITTVFEQSDSWLGRINVPDIGRLNQIVRQDRVQELILVAEAQHEQNIAEIAMQIHAAHETRGARLVLVSGPSSSGKTTFSKRLAIQLLARGLRPFTLEMDNYFVDRHLNPRDVNGDFDFETLEAINLALFNDNLASLLNGQRVQLPVFDFKRGRSSPGREVRLVDRQIVIIEGIHGLNPALVTSVSPEKVFRVYVSALTQVNVDSHNRVPTTDVRLLRRIVRDAHYRGYNATQTLLRWSSVRRGEKRHIFPYQENAHVMFNSALVYELAALRPLAEPLLLQVDPDTPPHLEANRLLSFLRWVQMFSEAQTNLIPDTSLLREFIGGSILRDYHPGVLNTFIE